jgi:hypothetical protein
MERKVEGESVDFLTVRIEEEVKSFPFYVWIYEGEQELLLSPNSVSEVYKWVRVCFYRVCLNGKCKETGYMRWAK